MDSAFSTELSGGALQSERLRMIDELPSSSTNYLDHENPTVDQCQIEGVLNNPLVHTVRYLLIHRFSSQLSFEVYIH